MPTKRAHTLTRDEILATSLRIIDDEGLDALSMRRLARESGVEAMSLYHHFKNKDAILDGVVGAIVSEMRPPDPMPSDWVEQLVELVDAFRRALTGHPNAMPLMLTRPMGPPEEAMITPVSVLQGQGLDPARMVEMYQALMALTFGHAFVSRMAAVTSGEAAPGGVTPPLLGEEGFRKAARLLIEGFAEEGGAA